MESNEMNIELQESATASAAEAVQLPLNFLRFGEVENDDVKVYIKQDVYKALEKLASSDTTKELGSILVGEYAEEMGKIHVIISGFIEAKYTDASASTLTFTHDTWEYVYAEQEKSYPGKRIVGWQHTHPNYGIFLSNYDTFIQENFFNMPFQVAYVIDPIQNIRGFFQWKNGEIAKLRGYYVYDEVGKPVKIEQKKIEKKEEKSNLVRNTALGILAFLMLATSLIFGIIAINLKAKYNEQEAVITELSEALIEQTVPSSEAKGEEEPQPRENSETNDFIEEIKEKTGGEAVRFFYHKVIAGDSLVKICEKYELSYEEYRDVILAINGIANPNLIREGQMLLLPGKFGAEN